MRGAALLAGLVVGACFAPQLGDAPYLCGSKPPVCPPGYRCNVEHQCERIGLMVLEPRPDGATAADARGLDARVADAAGLDARIADAAVRDAAVAAECLASCGPASCAGATCGRSSCGYDCGDCASTAIAAPCIDHYGQMLEEGAAGVRTCAEAGTLLERCLCGGGGAVSWVSCAGGCVPEGCSRAGQIGCGYQSCERGQVCCRNGRSSSCTSGACATGGTARCDGPEDCTGGVCCSTDTAGSAACKNGSTCGGALMFCHSTFDCPLAAPRCCATGIATGIKACYATVQEFGCN